MKVYLSKVGNKDIKGKIFSILFEVPIKLIDLHNLKNYMGEEDYFHFIKDNIVVESSPEKIESLKKYNLGMSKVFIYIMFDRKFNHKHLPIKIPTYSSIIRNKFYLFLYPKQTHVSYYEYYIKVKKNWKRAREENFIKVVETYYHFTYT